MRVYVAGKFQDKVQVKWLMDRLEELGHDITFDWTTEHYAKKEETAEDAEQCLSGVFDADVFVGLFTEDYIYKGALIEMGFAMAEEGRIYIIGHAIDSCIFSKLADRQFDTEYEFLNYIANE